MDISYAVNLCCQKRQLAGYSFSTSCYDLVQAIVVTSGILFLKKTPESHGIPIIPGMFVLLRREGQFTLFCRDQGYSGIGVSLQGDVPSIPRGEALSGTLDPRLRFLVQMVSRHIEAPLPESSPALQGLGHALLWEILALVRERHMIRGSHWADAAATAISLNLGANQSLQQTLRSIPLSYRQISRCFQHRFGVSPKKYQALVRIEEARRLLGTSHIDITSIAIELGYASSQHFSTEFRRLTGFRPTEFRKRTVGTTSL